NFFFCKDLYEEEMQKLHKTNPFLAFNLELYGSNLNFLLKLGDRAVQKVLREIEMEDLEKALKDESNEIWDKITGNMSRRAATLLREDMEYMGPVKRSDIIEAKNKIVNIAKRLEESGNIVLFNQLF
ncbi:MAG: FliG C-terminal domain-containing protein, partial [Treponemataceae bacterium]|nr:FliG C-terminal domain-containing protein [Treponemataceae bacterium]